MVGSCCVDVRSLAEPFAVENRTIRARHGDDDICIRNAFFAAVHGGYLYAESFAHSCCESLPALRIAAEDTRALDGADIADRFKLGASLIAGAYDADCSGVLARHVLCCYAAGGAGADLPKVAGFQQGKQFAGLGAEELHIEFDRIAGRHAIRL